jgi:hypothetical protein
MQLCACHLQFPSGAETRRRQLYSEIGKSDRMFHGLACCRNITYRYRAIIYTSGVEEAMKYDLGALLSLLCEGSVSHLLHFSQLHRLSQLNLEENDSFAIAHACIQPSQSIHFISRPR